MNPIFNVTIRLMLPLIKKSHLILNDHRLCVTQNYGVIQPVDL